LVLAQQLQAFLLLPQQFKLRRGNLIDDASNYVINQIPVHGLQKVGYA